MPAHWDRRLKAAETASDRIFGRATSERYLDSASLKQILA